MVKSSHFYTSSNNYVPDGGYSMLWCKPRCDRSLHLQPLRFFWSPPMGVWELGDGNESSWAIMNVLIQVCFDEIPPDWSQITEQNSESLLATVMKAILTGNLMESTERLQGSLQDTFSVSSLHVFLFPSFLIPLWSLSRMKSDECVYSCTTISKSKIRHNTPRGET